MELNFIKKVENIINNAAGNEARIIVQLKKLIQEYELQHINSSKDLITFSDLFSKAINHQKTESKRIIKTGFVNFDKKFGGLTPGEFVVLGGRPSMGKTQFLVSLCRNISLKIPVLYCTFDLTEFVLTNRFISSISNIPIHDLLHNNISEYDKSILALLQKKSYKHQLFINDKHSSIYDFKEYCLKQIKENNIKVIIIDYLQKMTAKKDKDNNRSHISTITKELKSLANDSGVLIIVASQLNRAVEIRGYAKRPLLADLRGSESIEEDADKVLFIYCPYYYGITVDEMGRSAISIVELTMAKNRNGPLGTVKLAKDKDFLIKR